jgi:hypothetical protein
MIKFELLVYFASILMSIYVMSQRTSGIQKISLLVGSLLSFTFSITLPTLLSLGSVSPSCLVVGVGESSNWQGYSTKLTFSPRCFETVLKDPLLYEEFKKVVAQQFCHENLCFFEAYRDLRQKYKRHSSAEYHVDGNVTKESADSVYDGSPVESLGPLGVLSPPPPTFRLHKLPNIITDLSINRQRQVPVELRLELMNIYREFVTPNCPQELNLSSTVRDYVTDRINNGDFRIQIMKPVFEEVYRILYSNTFLVFIRTFHNRPPSHSPSDNSQNYLV